MSAQLNILRKVAEIPSTADAVAGHLGMPQDEVKAYLIRLRNEGLVSSASDSAPVFWKPTPAGIQSLQSQ